MSAFMMVASSSLIRNYQGIKELDATIINALIDKILVSEREKLVYE